MSSLVSLLIKFLIKSLLLSKDLAIFYYNRFKYYLIILINFLLFLYLKMSIFGNFTKGLTNFLDFGNNDEDLNTLSHEELLRKVSSINQENNNLQKSINEISKENYLLDNSIVNDNNKKNSEFSKFLNLMQMSLIQDKNNKNNNDIKYTNKDFKKFLYKEQLFYGCLDENDIDILLKAKKDNKIEWDNKAQKEKYKLKQEILEKNLKNLYSNIFAIKVNNKKNKKDNKGKKKIKDNNDINNNIVKKENEDNEKKKVKGKKLFEDKFLDLNMNKGLLYENKKNDNEVNMLEELIFNDDKNKDNDDEN